MEEGEWTEDVPALGLDCGSLEEAVDNNNGDDNDDDYAEIGLDALDDEAKPVDPWAESWAVNQARNNSNTPTTPSRMDSSQGGISMTSSSSTSHESTF